MSSTPLHRALNDALYCATVRADDAGLTNDEGILLGMTRIAHLSDFHLLEGDHEARRGLERRRLAYLSFGRAYDAEGRKRRARDALALARATSAEHLVITGDLTEDGATRQFEILAGLLHESGWDPARVTLVPGNHDLYAGHDAWSAALEGPLRAFRDTSAPGVPVSLRDLVLVPISTAITQPYTRSAGAIRGVELEAAAQAAARARLAGQTLLLAMHHPPVRHVLPPLQWIDGLRHHAAIGAILGEHDHAHVLHGHTHAAHDRPVRPGATPRIFSTEAVVDGKSPVRVYRARHGRLWPETAVVAEAMLLAPA